MSSSADLAAGAVSGAGGYGVTAASSSTTMASGSSILSDKVSRALEVRTDTPAMRAALDALSNLPSSGGASSSAQVGDAAAGSTASVGGGIIDARSVRVAIERDALRQALLFEAELRSLVNTVSELRSSVSAVSGAAARVARSVETGVVVTHGSQRSPGEEKEGGADEDDDMQIYSGARASSSSSEEERRLAALLSDAFRARNEAARRAETVSAFLDRFDLSDIDAQLLDHYAFEEFDPSSSAQQQQQQQNNDGGMNLDPDSGERKPSGDSAAFLDALERVRAIRTELVKTFGDDGSLGSPAFGRRHRKSGKKSDEKLGAASAVRMMESLASRQERAYSRLYHFLQAYLDLNSVSHVPTSSAMTGWHHGGTHRTQHAAAASTRSSRFGDDDEADEALFAHPFVKRSLRVLRHVPAYRSHTLELIAGARRGEVTRRFLLALTSGYGGAPPLEMRAHDPVAYVGDMLAFAFRAFSVEAELSRGLVDYDPREERRDGSEYGGGGGNDNAEDDGGDDDEDDHNEDALGEDDDPLSSVDRPMTSSSVLSTAVSGLARPLRSRIGQVVSSLARRPDEDEEVERHLGSGHGSHHGNVGGGADLDEESSAALHHLAGLYSICGLLLFYRSAFEKGVRKLEANAARAHTKKGDASSSSLGVGGGKSHEEENPLVQCSRQCLTEAAAAYAAALRVYAASLGSDSPSGSSASSPADLARTAVVKICDVRSSSPGFAVDVGMTLTVHGGHEGRAKEESDALLAALASLELDFLCGALLGPALMGEGRGGCRTLDDAVALKVALATAKRAGLGAASYAKWDAAIADRERGLADELIRTETRAVLRACGLGPVVDALRTREAFVEGQTVASHPGLAPKFVEAAVKEFYASLYSPPLPSFEDVIKDPVLRKYARGRTAEGVADAYGELYEAVTGEDGGYDDVSFLGHDPNQVRTLLSL